MASNWHEKALRKLDALCAEMGMGWHAIDGGWGKWYNSDSHHERLEIYWNPSRRWTEAGEVFEKMRDTGRNPLLNWLPDKLKWHACMKIEGDGNWKDTGNRVAVFVEPCVHALTDSPTLAITLAAVAACSGKMVEEIEKECQQ